MATNGRARGTLIEMALRFMMKYAGPAALACCGTAASAASIICDVSVTKLYNDRPQIFHDVKAIPFSKSTPDNTVLYQWGTNKITADIYTSGDLGIVWEEKPFGYRSGTFESSLLPKRHFFIEDENAKIGVDIRCERKDN